MRKILRKISAFGLSLIFVLALTTTLRSTVSASEITSTVRESVVVVYTCIELKDGGEQPFGWGTGFFVGNLDENPEYLITNHHVIDKYIAAGQGELYSYEFDDGTVVPGRSKIRVFFDSTDFVEAYLIDYDSAKDIALLKLDKPTEKRKSLSLCVPTEDMVGTSVFCVGYPGLSENIFTDATSSWGQNDASITSGTISRFVTQSGTGARRIQTDAAIMQGHSGGPMINSEGAVIGVNVEVVADNSGIEETMYYAVNVDEIIPMLKLHDVDYVMSTDKKELPIVPIVIGIAAVAVVIIIILVIILISKKKKTNKQNRNEQPAVNVSPANNKTPAVRSLAAQHNMARYPINSGRIVIGRDPQTCTVVFSKNTPGISGRHCEVMWDAASGDFILTDLNSSYGTFLSNGQRLAPNATYRLKPGESFYLAEGANTIRVELE